MNFKVVFNKLVHKIPSDVKTFEDLLKSIHIIFLNKIPKSFDLTYEDEDKDIISIINEEDFELAV